MSNIDLGNSPQGTPPDAMQQAQMRNALGIVAPTGQQIEQTLDTWLGTGWKLNKIVDPYDYGNTSNPNNWTVYNFESTIVLGFYSDTEFVTLHYAGQFDNYNCYTIDGTINQNIDIFVETGYMVLCYDIVNGYWRLRVTIQGTDIFYYTLEPDLQNILTDPALWYNSSSGMYNEVSSSEVPSIPYVPATINLEFYKSDGLLNNFYLSTIGSGGVVNWVEVVGRNGELGTPTQLNLTNANGLNLSINDSTTGTLGYVKGGTNAGSQQAAIANLSAWVISVTSNKLVDVTEKGSILSVSAIGTVTITIQANMADHFNFRVLRRGTGDVVIAGQAGVTLLSANSHTKIANQYDLITVTRVASNIYVLSGNLKA